MSYVLPFLTRSSPEAHPNNMRRTSDKVAVSFPQRQEKCESSKKEKIQDYKTKEKQEVFDNKESFLIFAPHFEVVYTLNCKAEP